MTTKKPKFYETPQFWLMLLFASLLILMLAGCSMTPLTPDQRLELEKQALRERFKDGSDEVCYKFMGIEVFCRYRTRDLS